MSAIGKPAPQRFILDSVPWERYSQILRALSDRHLRMTYDRGTLEIMTLSFEHESLAAFLVRLVIVLTEELNLSIEDGRSTTLRRKRKQKGLEPDNCFWIAHAEAMRGKKKFDLRVDPPPDLAIEVDISHSSLNRMAIYASLRVPEVWRHDGSNLAFFTLDADGQYLPAAQSQSFPMPITPADLMSFINLRGPLGNNAIVKQFRTWIHGRIEPAAQA